LPSVFFLIILFFELERFIKKNLSRRTQADQKKTFSEVSFSGWEKISSPHYQIGFLNSLFAGKIFF